MKFVLIFAFLTINCAFNILQNTEKKDETAILGDDQNIVSYANTIGSLFTDEQVQSFKKYAFSASSFYGPLALDNLQYITNKMNNDFYQLNSVFIQMKTTYYVNYKIYPIYGQAYASFGPGFNNAQPQWSYLSFSNRRPLVPMDYIFVSDLGQGNGFKSTEVDQITAAIKDTESYSSCRCMQSQFRQFLSKISDTFVNINVICQSDNPATGYIQVFNNRWLVFKPLKCYYTIWANE